jgi:hypothetical protein
MAKGGFNAKKLEKKKQIRVEVEGAVMEIIREDGQDPHVTGGKEGGLDLNNLPPDTVIFTHTNPTCGYYYFNRKWWYI